MDRRRKALGLIKFYKLDLYVKEPFQYCQKDVKALFSLQQWRGL